MNCLYLPCDKDFKDITKHLAKTNCLVVQIPSTDRQAVY